MASTNIAESKRLRVAAAAPVSESRMARDTVQRRELIRYDFTPSVPVPVRTLERYRLVGAPGRAHLWDRFCVLRSQVLRVMAQNGWRTLGITSAGRGEGKTWTAVNLAISIALRVGHTALLVDANLRRPAVHRHFGIEGDYGLGSHLSEGVPLEQMLVHPVVGNLSVLPAGAALSAASDYFGSEQMRSFMQDVAMRYANRTVILDLPAIGDGDDVIGMLPHVDALLLVVADGVTRRDALAQAVDVVAGVRIIGTVLNKADEEGEA